MNIAEVRKVVGRIKASLFKKSNSQSIGSLKSNFKGTGLQFREHQIYAPGDDVRFIDWKILAKTSTPFVKTFEEERNVDIAVIIDASDSMLLGYKGISKLQASIELTCLLYLLAKETGDTIHSIIISDKVRSVDKSSGEAGITRFIKALEAEEIINNSGKVRLDRISSGALTENDKSVAIKKYLKKNREVVIFSDFNDFINIESFNNILYRKNTHAFRLRSPLEDSVDVPYTFFTSLQRGAGGCFAKQKKERDNAKSEDFKRVKRLYVNEPYLEKFVKELS